MKESATELMMMLARWFWGFEDSQNLNKPVTFDVLRIFFQCPLPRSALNRFPGYNFEGLYIIRKFLELDYSHCNHCSQQLGVRTDYEMAAEKFRWCLSRNVISTIPNLWEMFHIIYRQHFSPMAAANDRNSPL